MKTENQTEGQPQAGSDAVFSDWLDGMLEIPSAVLAFVWGGVVFLVLTPFVFVIATCSNKEKQVWLGLWLRDRVKVAMRGRDSLNDEMRDRHLKQTQPEKVTPK